MNYFNWYLSISFFSVGVLDLIREIKNGEFNGITMTLVVVGAIWHCVCLKKMKIVKR